jgi:hypothetical protein
LLESFWLNLRNGFPILVFLTWFSRSLAGPARIPVPFTQDVRPEGPQDLDNSYINHYNACYSRHEDGYSQDVAGYCTSGAALLSKAAGLLFILFLIASEIPFNWRFHNGH